MTPGNVLWVNLLTAEIACYTPEHVAATHAETSMRVSITLCTTRGVITVETSDLLHVREFKFYYSQGPSDFPVLGKNVADAVAKPAADSTDTSISVS